MREIGYRIEYKVETFLSKYAEEVFYTALILGIMLIIS